VAARAAARLLLPCLLSLGACQHPIPTPMDCPAICDALDRCSYLPSVLGPIASPMAVDAGSTSAERIRQCQHMCSLSSEDQAYAAIQACWNSAAQPAPADTFCVDLGQCLHAQFPTTPITGTSGVELHARVFDDPAQGSAGGGGDAGAAAPPICAADGGSSTMQARAFVEAWGIRQYSALRACEPNMVVEFPAVPAAKQVPVGFQLFAQDGTCGEYGRAVDVPAGFRDLPETIDLSASTRGGCPLAALGDAGAGTGAAATLRPTDGGEQ
jgi:hypothetical protein